MSGNDKDDTPPPAVRVSSLETLKSPSLRTVQLEFFDDHECVAFDTWWRSEGKRIFDAWAKSR